ncbi:hypothetical protein MPTK2_8g04850 [Marchantia polymorpha subsp. ruderalis]
MLGHEFWNVYAAISSSLTADRDRKWDSVAEVPLAPPDRSSVGLGGAPIKYKSKRRKRDVKDNFSTPSSRRLVSEEIILIS